MNVKERICFYLTIGFTVFIIMCIIFQHLETKYTVHDTETRKIIEENKRATIKANITIKKWDKQFNQAR